MSAVHPEDWGFAAKSFWKGVQSPLAIRVAKHEEHQRTKVLLFRSIIEALGQRSARTITRDRATNRDRLFPDRRPTPAGPANRAGEDCCEGRLPIYHGHAAG
jgi:hypothetical protein